MKYTVLGPRVLMKVKKLSETMQEGGRIVALQETVEKDTMAQTIGVVEQIGPTVNTTYEGFTGLAVGQKVHFQRYGAQRINVKENEEFERWIINGKDILCIEEDKV